MKWTKLSLTADYTKDYGRHGNDRKGKGMQVNGTCLPVCGCQAHVNENNCIATRPTRCIIPKPVVTVRYGSRSHNNVTITHRKRAETSEYTAEKGLLIFRLIPVNDVVSVKKWSWNLANKIHQRRTILPFSLLTSMFSAYPNFYSLQELL